MRQTLINFLTYCIERLRNGECTEEELESAYREAVTHIDVRGTCDDFARFYGQPKTNIRNVLSRRYIPETQKPRRSVTYNFRWFDSIIPKSWRKS